VKIISNYLLENKIFISKFIIHHHNARNTNEHYDLRFIDNRDSKKLNSFAFGKDFLEKINSKIVGVRTKDHNIRWLTLQSYRLQDIDKGDVTILVSSFSYFKLDFKGSIIKGVYELFKVRSGRGDNWMLIKKK
jgi:hypothetical protein